MIIVKKSHLLVNLLLALNENIYQIFHEKIKEIFEKKIYYTDSL